MGIYLFLFSEETVQGLPIPKFIDECNDSTTYFFFKFISHFMRILNTLFFLIEITVDFYMCFFFLYIFSTLNK